ncbi:EF-P lysine aminoacylase EpmA [Desulfobacterota bacterium M19]
MRLNTASLRERARVLQAVRSFFIDREYLEVETPIRIPAPIPEAWIEVEAAGDWFLQTSPEICMKRLLSAGLPRIFQICKCFRRHERGSRHLPEMTMLEWYTAHADYHDLMRDCEELLNVVLSPRLPGFDGSMIDLSPPWPRLSLSEAFKRYASISLHTALAADSFDEVLSCEVEPRLGLRQPVFIIDYPASLASLAALHPDNPALAQRFELYISGMELANGFTELNDAREQRLRFRHEQELIRARGRELAPMPEPFLTDLSHMPPAAGIAMGLDRLLMISRGICCIDEVTAFTPEEL